MKRYLAPALILAAAILAVSRLWISDADVAKPVIPGMNVAEQAARREAATRLARMAPALPHAQVGAYPAETIKTAEQAFRGMISVRGLVIQDKERRALAEQILALPDGSALMREILLDPAFARSAFGDFQAEARFYAIATLKEVARQGNVDFVSETAAALTNQLGATSGAPDRGRGEDLMAIVAIVGESVGAAGFKDASSPALAKLGCTPALPPAVRELCLRGVHQGVWAADGIEQAQAVVKRVQDP
jgi:hypothetical protein